jgi:Cys-tRNA(Pro)/Cys-tRNA(Cys) deacylase
MRKTNAQRLLESRRIPYESEVYDESGEFHSAEEVARLIGAPVESVYKTLVVMREQPRRDAPQKARTLLLVMVAADREIDLRQLARSSGEKKLRMATRREAEQLTGMEVGGISALALLERGFQTCIDRAALALDQIHISGGARGLDLRLRVSDLIQVTQARVVDATTPPPAMFDMPPAPMIR